MNAAGKEDDYIVSDMSLEASRIYLISGSITVFLNDLAISLRVMFFNAAIGIYMYILGA